MSRSVQLPHGCSLVGLDSVRTYVFFNESAPVPPSGFVVDMMPAAETDSLGAAPGGARLRGSDETAGGPAELPAQGGTSGLWQPLRALFGMQVIVPVTKEDVLGGVRWTVSPSAAAATTKLSLSQPSLPLPLGPEVFRQVHSKWLPTCTQHGSAAVQCGGTPATAAVPLFLIRGTGSV